MTQYNGTLTHVTDDVYAWLQPDGSWWLNNAGAINTTDGVVLVDTCASESRTRALLDAVKKATQGGEIAAAVNTHAHGDHTYGNSVLPANTVIIGHEDTRTSLLEDSLLDACPPLWHPMPDWGNVTRRPPLVTTRDGLTLHHGGRRIEIRHPGATAHTTGDLVVWLPESQVLFTGDLLFHGVTPLVLSGSVEGALRSLDWIAGFDPAHVVPGHGGLLDASTLPEVLETHRRYYQLVLDSARAGLRDGLTPLAAAHRIPLDEFAGLPDAERIVLNLHRAYADSGHKPLDIKEAWSDALALNGGPLATHL
ncbi:MBL fold metallo-hydrolase [Streptomyces sp. NPDC047981]|uniref:MBL fold metallo-hydrolase n=1 Tax=Streptomyces sp. NPDC047981 TaxID=3154610 RepID=UPI003422A325